MMRFHIYKVIGLLFLLGQVVSCATVSFDQPKTPSHYIKDVSDTSLNKVATKWSNQHGGTSGFYPLFEGMDALGARLRLAERAEVSLDLQYFLMKDDTAGDVMAAALLKAADRGVRIRFLLDDVFTTASDRVLMLMNQHPMISIRMFNPVSRRGVYSLNFLGDFNQANRRMHNKSYTADSSVSLVGGRNIANEYFQLKDDSIFFDLDVVAVGPVVPEISKSFDDFWNHSLAVPLEQFIPNKGNENLDDFRKEVDADLENIHDTVYARALESKLLQDLIADRRPLFSAQAEVISDNPDKLINEISEEHMHLAMTLGQMLKMAKKEVMIITPYYVPGKQGVELARGLVDSGVRVFILTNSLASNNHVAVHSGYARYRRDVVNAGVELYEAQAYAEPTTPEAKKQIQTLHTKAIIIDRRHIFIGSLNVDPRSIKINAEMGLLIDSSKMAGGMAYSLDDSIVEIAYRIVVNEDGKLEWHSTLGDKQVVETKEPQTSWWLRTKAWFSKIAPESQL